MTTQDISTMTALAIDPSGKGADLRNTVTLVRWHSTEDEPVEHRCPCCGSTCSCGTAYQLRGGPVKTCEHECEE